jgi:hypothetical protein
MRDFHFVYDLRIPSALFSSPTGEDGRMGCCGLRCWTVSGVVVCLIGIILAFTFPLVYDSILNYVSPQTPKAAGKHF